MYNEPIFNLVCTYRLGLGFLYTRTLETTGLRLGLVVKAPGLDLFGIDETRRGYETAPSCATP
jgi:hypothetical protein